MSVGHRSDGESVWDMAYWGRQDSRKDISTDMPLRTEQIDHWLSRMRSLIEHVRVTWPGTPVWLRTVPRALTRRELTETEPSRRRTIRTRNLGLRGRH